MKRVFVASDHGHAGRVVRVRADDLRDAARVAAGKLFPVDPSERWKFVTRGKGFFVQRRTGTSTKYGLFCAYRDVREGGTQQVGCLQVWEPPAGWR